MTIISMDAGMSIEQLGCAVADFLESKWKVVLEENIDEFMRLFPEYEDATYGIYLEKLIPPIWEELVRNGIQTVESAKEDDFIIAGCLNFRNSMEKAEWGTPDHELRVFWIVLENRLQERIGTFIFEFFHSHIQFDIPAPPRLVILHSTERKEIVGKILERRNEQK
ncbi:DUF6022 family protein [Paenibacillus tarimensis]